VTRTQFVGGLLLAGAVIAMALWKLDIYHQDYGPGIIYLLLGLFVAGILAQFRAQWRDPGAGEEDRSDD
jgi:hypothetical protein